MAKLKKEAQKERIPTERPEPGTKAERKWIKKERKILRKELKAKGITNYADFEMVARDLGLVFDGGKKALLLAWLRNFWMALKTFPALTTLLLAGAAFLAAVFVMSAITENAGSFTVNMTADMLNYGFTLSFTEDFEDPQSRLFGEPLDEMANITLSDIPEDLDDIDGNHNGEDYIALTFYIQNTGANTSSFIYDLTLEDDTLGLSEAVWIMFYEDGKQVVYTKVSADGDAEELYGFKTPYFYEDTYYEEQYYEEDGKYGIITTTYADDNTVVQGIVEDVEPGEVHKYTIIIWIEGYDPECTNEIFGGYATYSIQFDRIEEEDDGSSIFSGIYREEYE